MDTIIAYMVYENDVSNRLQALNCTEYVMMMFDWRSESESCLSLAYDSIAKTRRVQRLSEQVFSNQQDIYSSIRRCHTLINEILERAEPLKHRFADPALAYHIIHTEFNAVHIREYLHGQGYSFLELPED